MGMIDDQCDKVRRWGKWGADDQLGAANFITPESIVKAAGLVQTGKVVSLAMPYDGNGPQTGGFGRVNPLRLMMQTGVDHVSGTQAANFPVLPKNFGFADDAVFMPLQSGTQWDALSHVFHSGKMWNGYSANEVTSTGAARNGIENASESLVGRGVLLDIPGYKGLEYLDDGYAITVEDLEGAESWGKVKVQEGDVLLVRTGQLGRYQKAGEWGTYAGGDAPGLSFHTGEWLCDKNIAAVAVDTWGTEVRPNDIPDAFQPLHLVLLVSAGIYLGEMFALDSLAAACKEDGRYEFLFVGPPLPFTGAVGSPLNPVAIK